MSSVSFGQSVRAAGVEDDWDVRRVRSFRGCDVDALWDLSLQQHDRGAVYGVRHELTKRSLVARPRGVRAADDDGGRGAVWGEHDEALPRGKVVDVTARGNVHAVLAQLGLEHARMRVVSKSTDESHGTRPCG
eukprot:30497-Pelagococcus_subviridis.AAC.11